MTYNWETIELEEIIESTLERDIGKSNGKTRYGYYTTTKKHLIDNVLQEIKAELPEYTDHGPEHIKNVLENVLELIGNDIDKLEKIPSQDEKLNGVELYILGMSVLFHDVGNIINRKDHQKNISKIYDFARLAINTPQDQEEKKIILNICDAHTGEGLDGSKNTLKTVIERSKIDNKAVRPNLLAPILRFADELAEGEQRTSNYMIKHLKYSKESLPFHKYANCSKVDIDRKNGRIRLTFHLNLSFKKSDVNNGSIIPINELKEFLNFIYNRIEKLNQERQYNKFYCKLLDPFKETSASFNFWYNNEQLYVPLEHIVFSDLVIPGDPQKSIVEQHPAYEPELLIKELNKSMKNIKS